MKIYVSARSEYLKIREYEDAIMCPGKHTVRVTEKSFGKDCDKYFFKNEWFLTKEEAIMQAEKNKEAELARLIRSIRYDYNRMLELIDTTY